MGERRAQDLETFRDYYRRATNAVMVAAIGAIVTIPQLNIVTLEIRPAFPEDNRQPPANNIDT
jgi:hypothetical protein